MPTPYAQNAHNAHASGPDSFHEPFHALPARVAVALTVSHSLALDLPSASRVDAHARAPTASGSTLGTVDLTVGLWI